MGGVDKSDQMLGYYSFTRKAVKWWKKVYFHLLSLALVNAHKIYVMQNIEPSNQAMPLSTFLKAVVRDLVGTRLRIQVEDVSPLILQSALNTS